MTTLSAVQNPYTQILGLTGTGLTGSVYIGIANLDPQTNPQAVYWDAAGTIPASQPLSVVGGYVMRSGAAVQAFTAPTYSIRALSSPSNTLVFYMPIVTDPTAASAAAAAASAAAAAASAATAASTGIIYQNGPPTDDTKGGNGATTVDQLTGIAYGPKANGTWAGAGTYTFLAHTAPSVPIPLGAVGAWWSSDYSTSGGRPYIPNSLLVQAAPKALNAAPRRLFSNVNLWSTTGLTVTDNNATAPDGTGQATTIANAGSNWYVSMIPNSAVTLTAGTYSMWASVRWKGTGGTAATFKIGDANSGTTTRTATTSWGRFFGTFTTVGGSSNYPGIFTPNGTSPADFEIIDLQLASGTLDPNPDWTQNSTQEHLFLGPSPSYKTPSYSSGYIDLSTGNYGLIQFPVARTPTAVTVAVVGRRVSDGSADGFQPFISQVQNWRNFGFLNDIGAGPSIQWNNNNVLPAPGGVASNNGNLVDVNGGGWQVFTFRYDGTSGVQFLNDFKTKTQALTSGAASLSDMFAGILQDQTHYTGYEVAGIVYYERSLTDNEVVTLQQAAFQKVLTSGITRQAQKIILHTGDSIAAGNSGTNWMFQYNPSASPHYHGIDLGVGGQTITAMIADLPNQLAYINTLTLAGRVPVVIAHIGTNSIYHTGSEYAGNPSGALDALATWASAFRAAGCKVVMSQMLDRDDPSQSATWVADKVTFNAGVLSRAPASWDAGINYGTNANLSTAGGVSAANNATYFAADKTHPLTAGYALMAAIGGPVVDSLGTAA